MSPPIDIADSSNDTNYALSGRQWYRNAAHDKVVEGFEASLAKLDCGYIDMYLMHWPVAVVDGIHFISIILGFPTDILYLISCTVH